MFVIGPTSIRQTNKQNHQNPQLLSSTTSDKEKSLLEGFLLPMFHTCMKCYQEMWQHWRYLCQTFPIAEAILNFHGCYRSVLEPAKTVADIHANTHIRLQATVLLSVITLMLILASGLIHAWISDLLLLKSAPQSSLALGISAPCSFLSAVAWAIGSHLLTCCT